MITRGNSFKLPLYYIIIEDTKYMTILTRQERERREIENLYNEKARLEAIVTQFKSNNEEYLDKIKQAAYEEVKSVLTDSKLLLEFATQ